MTSLCHESTWYWCNFIWDITSEGYTYAAIGTLVVYDWLLLLEQEVDLVWKRRWTLVKFMYLALRILGIFYGITNVFYYAPRHVPNWTCVAFLWIVPVSEALGFFTLQIVMILRLYAMSGRSRKLLSALLFGFVIVQGIVFANTIRNAIVIGDTEVDQAPEGFPGVCSAQYGVFILPLLDGQYISLLIFEVLMLAISLFFFAVHLRQSRGQRGAWSTRNIVVLLVRDNVFYFVITAATYASESFSSLELGWTPIHRIGYDVLNAVLSGIVICILGPHLILSVLRHHAKRVEGSYTSTDDISAGSFAAARRETTRLWEAQDPLFSYDSETYGGNDTITLNHFSRAYTDP